MRSRFIAWTIATALTIVGLTAAGQRPAGLTDQQATALLARTARDIDQFHRNVDLEVGRRSFAPGPAGENIGQLVMDLNDSTLHLRDHAVRRQVIANDVDDVLDRGAQIDAFMSRQRTGTAAANGWITVRRDLDEVARAYNVTWSWSQPRYTPPPAPAFYHHVSGTYQLDLTQSDDARHAVDLATRSLPAASRQRAFDGLMRRLDAPETIAIDRTDDTVTIASSSAPRVTFDANGVSRSEPGAAGRVVTTRATVYGDQLLVSTSGNRGSDFTVTFEPIDGGSTLSVTRTIDSDNLTRPVTVRSEYRKTSDRPDWNLYTPVENSGFIVPNGEVITARLDNPLSTRTSREGERFSMTVQSPATYAGATITGEIARLRRPGPNGNRADMIFAFDDIRTRNGRTSDFVGMLNSARTPDGRTIGVSNEGVARPDTVVQPDDAVQRGAIGAAVGAIIGAIAGGGKGAAIGAAVGASSGAGTVFLDGRADLDLPAGTEVTILSTAPR